MASPPVASVEQESTPNRSASTFAVERNVRPSRWNVDPIFSLQGIKALAKAAAGAPVQVNRIYSAPFPLSARR